MHLRKALPGMFYAAALVAAPTRIVTTLVDFNGADGANPKYMALVQGTDGYLYGTTALLANAPGVWRIAPDGSKYANPTDVVQIAKIERFMKMLTWLWIRSRLAIN
jgi:hypothetical protein